MKRLLKPVFSVAALAALAMPSTATAQSEELISNPRGMIANFDIPNLGPVLTELGIVWQRKVNDSGRGFIAASVGGQLSFNLVPTACQGVNDTNCIGLILVSLHGGNSVNTQTVSAFNQAVPFTSAGMLGNNAGAFLTRYEISDYGIPRGNVASSVYNFVGAATGFKEQLDTLVLSAWNFMALIVILSTVFSGLGLISGLISGAHQVGRTGHGSQRKLSNRRVQKWGQIFRC